MKVFVKFLWAIISVVVISLLMAIPTMLLWNLLMPDIFGLVKISLWQALGINILSGILFKSHHSNIEKEEK